MTNPPSGPGWWQGPDGRWYPPRPPGPSGAAPPGPPPPRSGPPPNFPQQHSGQPQYNQPPYGQAPYGQEQYRYRAHGQQQYGQPPYRQAAYEQHPYGPAQYGQPPPGGPPPGHPPPAFGVPPSAPARQGSKSKVVAIVVGAAVAVVGLTGLALYGLVSSLVGSVAGDREGGCRAVATADVNAALGGTYEVVALDGAIGGLTAPVLDSRVLPDAELTCWAVEAGEADTGGRLARIARHEGTDAAQRFVAERTAAMGTTEDRGGGLSVSSSGYFNKDIAAGDEAFCTSGDFLGSAGALVRRGNVLVYVSTTAAGKGAGAAPDIQLPSEPSPGDGLSFGTDDDNCDLAVALAAKVS